MNPSIAPIIIPIVMPGIAGILNAIAKITANGGNNSKGEMLKLDDKPSLIVLIAVTSELAPAYLNPSTTMPLLKPYMQL